MRRALVIVAGVAAITLLFVIATVGASQSDWKATLRSLPIQKDGRVMPLDTYARSLAAQITGRARWSKSRGPDAYAGREPIELLADLLFHPRELVNKPLVRVLNRPFKRRMGLDPQRDFFSPDELSRTESLITLINEFHVARRANPDAQPTPEQDRALDVNAAVSVVARFVQGETLPMVPTEGDSAFLHIGRDHGEPGTTESQAALSAFGQAYLSGGDLDAAALALHAAIQHDGKLSSSAQRRMRFELFYNDHAPWRMALMANLLAIIGVGLGAMLRRRWLVSVGVICAAWTIAEQMLGFGLRMAILERAPVSNMYESLLWMGVVVILAGVVAQMRRPSGQYLIGGLIASALCVLFAMLVPLSQQTNALPAVLRSNYWLIVHVLVIVASYGLFILAAVLGHVYLAAATLTRRSKRAAAPLGSPIIAQMYRVIQLGVLLLTVGTILGGVWAADSWGRFWGWDPKETWALISIILYFSMLHARYVGWLRDFGLAVASIVGFIAIVWTFYGVNYIMASGLHSYGFGSGGQRWIVLWVIVETLFVLVCAARRPRARALQDSSPASAPSSHVQSAAIPESS